MNTTPPRRASLSFRPLTAAAILASALATPAAIAAQHDNTKAGAAESSDCRYGRAHDGSGGCMSRQEYNITRERQAALDADPSQYERNALMRCDRFSPEDRIDCVARVKGQGTVSGSVEGGGIYREYSRMIPGEAAAGGLRSGRDAAPSPGQTSGQAPGSAPGQRPDQSYAPSPSVTGTARN